MAPVVGGKHYSYTEKGVKAAKAASKKSRMPMEMMESKKMQKAEAKSPAKKKK